MTRRRCDQCGRLNSPSRGSCACGDPPPSDTPPSKWCYLGGPPYRSLELAVTPINIAFDEQAYLVGSVMYRPDFRDVDVRMIFDDEKFDILFGRHGYRHAFWRVLVTALSEYLEKRTGLPVDFQIQRRSSVGGADLKKIRDPLGVNVSHNPPPWRST